jgi:hypothetical protein
MIDSFEVYEKRIKELERELLAQKQLTHSVAQLSRSHLFDLVEGYGNEDCVSNTKALVVMLDAVIDSTKEVE